MQLSQQEMLILDRMAAHMIATGDTGIDSAIDAMRKHDERMAKTLIFGTHKPEPLCAFDSRYSDQDAAEWLYDGATAREIIVDRMSRRIYALLRTNPNHPTRRVVDGRLTFIGRNCGLPGSPVTYLINGSQTAYVSLEDLQLHMRGMCKEGCPRCALRNDG